MIFTFPFWFFLLGQEEGSFLFAFQGGVQTFGEEGKVCHQGVGFACGVVLEHGDEKDALAEKEGGDVLEVAGEAVVGGEGEEEGTVTAEVGFGCHGDGGVGDAPGDFG